MSRDITDMMKEYDGEQVKLGDVFSNPEVDLGVGSTDPTMGAIYPRARSITWNLQRIESVMRADPFFVRALEYRSSKPVRNGVDISSDEIESDTLSEFQKEIKRKVNPVIKDALFEADAFGWSGALIVIKGQMNKRDLKRPLRMDEITKDKFQGIKVLTRWYQINPTHEMITELGKKHEIYDPALLGTPLYYNVSFDGDRSKFMKVHRSRLIITSRNKLSYIEKKIEHFGGTSLLEQSFESLSRYHALVGQIHRILQKSTVPVLKIDELASAGLQTDQGSKLVEQKIEHMRENLNANNLFVIGSDDDLSFEDAQITGLENQLQEMRKELQASLNTPPHILFYEYSDYDKSEVDDFIQNRQEFKVRPFYERVLPMLYQSLYNEVMPDYELTFKPLETPTHAEIAEARLKNVEAIEKVYQMSAYNTKSVQNSLGDIDSNPSDVFRNLDPEYVKYIDELGAEHGYTEQQIMLAEALNKQEEDNTKEKSDGKNKGGDQNTAKKPTPRPDMKPGQKEE